MYNLARTINIYLSRKTIEFSTVYSAQSEFSKSADANGILGLTKSAESAYTLANILVWEQEYSPVYTCLTQFLNVPNQFANLIQ